MNFSFSDYQNENFFDEMFTPEGEIRPGYEHLKNKVGKYYENSIIECKLIERKKLYGFDAGKKHRFIEIKFANINIYNKTN